jgi:uncharacterized protein
LILSGQPTGGMVIADSGFWIALMVSDDAFHLRAKNAYRGLDSAFVTTWPVLTEVTHILASRVHPQAAVDFIDIAHSSGDILVWSPPNESMARIPALMQRYLTMPMDLADASLVLLAEALGHGRILTTDTRDFADYRIKNHHPFENLL